MADVRKEGPHFVTIRRIYKDTERGNRYLLFPEGKRIRAAEVELYGLEVEKPKAKATKLRLPGENK